LAKRIWADIRRLKLHGFPQFQIIKEWFYSVYLKNGNKMLILVVFWDGEEKMRQK